MERGTVGTSDDLRFEIEAEQEEDFRFAVDFGLGGVEIFVTDELEPLGGGEGPDPVRLLAAAVGNCLAASLLFCLRRRKIAPREIRALVTGSLTRTARGRLRIEQLDVVLTVDGQAGSESVMDDCLDRFEEFCIVTESVRKGIDVMVEVRPRFPESARTERDPERAPAPMS